MSTVYALDVADHNHQPHPLHNAFAAEQHLSLYHFTGTHHTVWKDRTLPENDQFLTVLHILAKFSMDSLLGGP